MPTDKESRDGLLHAMTSPETIGGLIDLDLSALRLAMKSLLGRNQEADEKLRRELDNLYKDAQQATYEPGSFDEADQDGCWLNLLHDGSYQSAAHSMAAAAMLAPFVETLFVRIFGYIRDQGLCDSPPAQKASWDPRKNKNGLFVGIEDLAKLTNLSLPGDCHQTLDALIYYRNKMFHNGLEWEKTECNKFQKRIQERKWPEDWFIDMNLRQDSRMFCMRAEFIARCFDTMDKVIDGFGEFVRNRCQHFRKSSG